MPRSLYAPFAFNMELITPDLAALRLMPGVYKISLDDEWFYIGSSQDLNKRISSWRCAFNQHKYLKNKNIKILLPKIKVIKIQILYVFNTRKEALSKESELLKMYSDHPGLLNRCQELSNKIQVKPYMGQLVKPKKQKTPKEIFFKQVAQFNKCGEVMKIYPSISEAAKALCITGRGMTKYLKFGNKCRGFILKVINPDGTYIEHIKKDRKLKKHKNFYQIDSNGNIVREYSRIQDAADCLGVYYYQVNNVLKKKPNYNTVRGFRLEYVPSLTNQKPFS